MQPTRSVDGVGTSHYATDAQDAFVVDKGWSAMDFGTRPKQMHN